VAELPSAVQDEDLAAKQFDDLILSTQLAVLRTEPSFSTLQERIVGVAAQLEELANIPMAKTHLALFSPEDARVLVGVLKDIQSRAAA
jgi:type I restriction enzyme R subunit